MNKTPKYLTCITCNEEKLLTDFPIVKGGYYQRGTKCKSCSKLKKQKYNPYPIRYIS